MKYTLAIGAALLAATPAMANFYATYPVGDTVWPAGSRQTIRWQDDGQEPHINDITSFKLELQTGTDLKQTTLIVVGEDLDPRTGQITFTIPENVGPTGKVYFFRFTPSEGDIRWTTRFTVTGANGVFPDDVELPPGSVVSRDGTTSTAAPTGTATTSSTATSTPTSTSTSSSSATPTETEEETEEETETETETPTESETQEEDEEDNIYVDAAHTLPIFQFTQIVATIVGAIAFIY
jgi:hypothetical protein